MVYSQDSGIYQVILHKSVESDVKNRKFIKIDSLGNIFNFNKLTGEKIDLKKFNKSIEQFLKKTSNIEIKPASDTESSLTVIPTIGEYTFEVTVKFLKDFHAEKNRKSMTKYYWVKVSETNQEELFLKYFSGQEKELLKRLLN